MLIQIGPVSQSSVTAWLDYCGGAMAVLREHDSPTLSAEALDAFEDLLHRWRAAAGGSGPFIWTEDESPEVIEFLIRGLYEAGLAIEQLNERGEADLRPPEADEFHVALVNQVIETLDQEGQGFSTFADMLRGVWGVAGRG